jgi:NAD+ kinase
VKSPADADVIVVCGGDGEMLRVIRKHAILQKKPVFGLNFGKVGYLLNPYNEEEDLKNLPERLAAAEKLTLHPLSFKATFFDKKVIKDFEVNEITVCNHFRWRNVTTEISSEKGKWCYTAGGDGIIVATDVGSTAYNSAAGGYILPLGSDAFALTPNNSRGNGSMSPCVVPSDPLVVKVLRDRYHKGDLCADDHSIGKDLLEVEIRSDAENPYTLMFDPGCIAQKQQGRRTQFTQLGV